MTSKVFAPWRLCINSVVRRRICVSRAQPFPGSPPSPRTSPPPPAPSPRPDLNAPAPESEVRSQNAEFGTNSALVNVVRADDQRHNGFTVEIERGTKIAFDFNGVNSASIFCGEPSNLVGSQSRIERVLLENLPSPARGFLPRWIQPVEARPNLSTARKRYFIEDAAAAFRAARFPCQRNVRPRRLSWLP